MTNETSTPRSVPGAHRPERIGDQAMRVDTSGDRRRSTRYTSPEVGMINRVSWTGRAGTARVQAVR